MAITKLNPRERWHSEMKWAQSSSENTPNKHSTPSKKIAKEKQPPTKRFTRSSSQFKTKRVTEDEGYAFDLSKDSREKNSKEFDHEAVVSNLSTIALDALAAVVGAQVKMPEATIVQTTIIPTESKSVAISTLRAYVDKEFAAMDELLGLREIQTTTVNTTITTLDTPLHQEQQSVNPIPPTHHQLVDELSEETQEPSPIVSQNTKPLGTPVNNPFMNMVIDSPVDEAPPQFSPRMVEHSQYMSHVSPVHTTTTPPTTGDAQDDDE
ncbi:hypothetical protein L6452_18442 [Arctium lappa]|uniref:Uncharacterized protein n=1 Tax=Arctium lappa TaxID=4217 RepID=A0ACB9C684_ARCLA|nr:hypothetical protein L6452_18442 [Arctium lappa]